MYQYFIGIMELRHIQYFKVLAEELHFGNAAKKLFISQPPLSRQIKELENELKAELFLRNNKKVELTEAGRYFYERTAVIIQELDQIKNSTKLIHDHISGEIKLGYISSTPKQIIAKILNDLKIAFPLLQVNLIESSSQDQIQDLCSGKLDISIIRGRFPSKDILQRLFFQDELCVVGPNNVEMNKEKITRADYISFNRDYAPEFYRLSLDFCKEIGFEPKVKHHCNNMNAILELVKLGLGYTIAPLSTVEEREDVNYISSSMLGKMFYNDVYLAIHSDNYKSSLKDIIDQMLKSADKKKGNRESL